MNFGSRLKTLREERGLTQQALGDIIKVSAVTVRAWEHNKKKPSMDALIALAETLDISIDAMLDVRTRRVSNCSFILSSAEKFLLNSYRTLDDYGQKAVNAVCSVETQRVKDYAKTTSTANVIPFRKSERYIPRYTTPSAAGSSIPFDGADFEMIRVDDTVPAAADFAVDIQGNSMFPYIRDGEMVYVKKDAELSIGDVGIFCVDGAMYCKQYYVNANGDLNLVSANPKLRHTNVVVHADSGQSVTVCGKVLLGIKLGLPGYLFEEE